MANQWLRLWHDMPNDPKWRTIARLSQQPISLVQAVYLHLLVDASRNVTRGHVDVTNEDLASALDVTEDAISAIREAMQNRVLSDDALSGWETRQPAREDSGDSESGAKSSTERKREERARKALALTNNDKSHTVTVGHDLSRNVTTDKDKEEIKTKEPIGSLSTGKKNIRPDDVDQILWGEWKAHRATKKASVTDGVVKSIRNEAGKLGWTLPQALRKCIDRGWAGFESEWVKADMDRGKPEAPRFTPKFDPLAHVNKGKISEPNRAEKTIECEILDRAAGQRFVRDGFAVQPV